MKKLSIYGVTVPDDDAEPQLLAEIKLHPSVAPNQGSRQRIMEIFKERGATVMSIMMHEEATVELA